jgi:O-succinylbenzoate synthase
MFHLTYRSYHRPFVQPLQTHHGAWKIRDGIIVQLTNEADQVGWGEIAPVPAFGSETYEQALAFCQGCSEKITLEEILAIPPELSACRFGFAAAWETLSDRHPLTPHPLTPHPPTPLLPDASSTSRLLPTGAAALQAWRPLWQQGARTFKWKIGVASWSEEVQILEQLMAALPAEVSLRLDANGGLSEAETLQWLHQCDRHSIEFLEQPLPPDQFDTMLRLSQPFQTPIALDESVATFDQLQACYTRGWRGIFVVKAAIAGFPFQLRDFCQQHSVDVVWSSVFETAIAQSFIQQSLIHPLQQSLIHPLQHSLIKPRAIGFGVNHWFTDDWHLLSPEQLWQNL